MEPGREDPLQPCCLPRQVLADLHPEALENLRDIAAHVGAYQKSSEEEGLVVYPKISTHPNEASTALPLVLESLEGGKGFMLWNPCFRSLFKLVRAPKPDSNIFLEVLVVTDTKAPVLLIFTESSAGKENSSAPDLNSYRISLAQALNSKIQSFISDSTCIMSAIVPLKKRERSGDNKRQDGEHSRDSKLLHDAMMMADEEAVKCMSPAALAMTAGKFTALVQATLAALAITTLYPKGDAKNSSGNRRGMRTFLRLPQFERICEPYLVRMAVRTQGKTVLAIEFAVRNSLKQDTLFVSNEHHVVKIMRDIKTQRGNEADLRSALYSDESIDSVSASCVVADDFDRNNNSWCPADGKPSLLKTLHKASTILLCINHMGTNDLNRTLRFQIPMYSGQRRRSRSGRRSADTRQPCRGNCQPPHTGAPQLPRDKRLHDCERPRQLQTLVIEEGRGSPMISVLTKGIRKVMEAAVTPTVRPSAKESTERKESTPKVSIPCALTARFHKCSKEEVPTLHRLLIGLPPASPVGSAI